MPVGSTSSAASETKVTYTRDTSNDSRDMTIDTQTFLKMLVTQLKYQDPLSPQDNSQFVSQMAQMSTLSEIKDMNGSLKNAQAFEMIGKQIYAEVTDPTTKETTAYTGVVSSVILRNGTPYVVVGTKAIAASDVLEVFPAPVKEDSTGTTPTGKTPEGTTPTDTTETSRGAASDSGTT